MSTRDGAEADFRRAIDADFVARAMGENRISPEVAEPRGEAFCGHPGALDDAAVMGGDGRVDQIAAQGPETHENPLLVGAANRL
jgi:hypothetical protein